MYKGVVGVGYFTVRESVAGVQSFTAVGPGTYPWTFWTPTFCPLSPHGPPSLTRDIWEGHVSSDPTIPDIQLRRDLTYLSDTRVLGPGSGTGTGGVDQGSPFLIHQGFC